MPLKIVAPRKGKSPNWRIRGAYLGVRVNRSAGTHDQKLARKILRKIERDIECGAISSRSPTTFASAAAAYMKNGGEVTFMRPLLLHFQEMPITDIDQGAIDSAAVILYPDATAATRNRQVYTPMSAILRHVGVKIDLRRPKGAQGGKQTAWLWPEQAQALFAEAEKIDHRFAALLITLCYTGLRLNEALRIKWGEIRLTDGFAYIPDTKNNEPRAVFLPPVLVAALANCSQQQPSESKRVFLFTKSGHLYSLLKAAAFRAGVDLPRRSAFHILRHTYATWMRRYAGLDTRGLVATGAWKDRKSADRYEHVVVSEEAKRAILLPPTRRAT